jgi:predicted transposase YbfD/YdcC
LLSQPLTADRFNPVARAHWGVERRLHWCLDVQMNEDRDRTRKDNGPPNLAILRHMALNVLRKDPRKESLRAKFKIADWNNACLTSLLEQF